MDYRSLVQVMTDSHIAPDIFLGSNDGIYPIANISCCIWIDATDQVEWAVHHLKEHAAWLRLKFMPYLVCSLGLCWEIKSSWF